MNTKRKVKKMRTTRAWALMQHNKLVECLPGKIGDVFVCCGNADKSGKSTYYAQRVTISWEESK